MCKRVDRRALLVAVAALIALVALVAYSRVLRGDLAAALSDLAAASPAWLWLAAASFVASVAAIASAWRAGLRSCGARLGLTEAGARYCTGSVVNSVAPGGCGGAVRIFLFSRVLPGSDRIWTAGGVAAAVGAARALALVPLAVAGAALAGFGARPLLMLGGAVGAAVLVAILARRYTPHRRVAHVFDVFRALGNAPREAATLVGWTAFAMVGRVAAAGCIAAALGVDEPLEAAIITVPALALAGVLPLTPGNVGVGSGAVAIALHAGGLDVSTAIAVGIAFQALETAVNVLAGACSLLYLSRLPLPAWSVRLAGATGCLALVGGVSATVL
jgi:uncharacterized membrane protein YbhN (UPF0104 family)